MVLAFIELDTSQAKIMANPIYVKMVMQRSRNWNEVLFIRIARQFKSLSYRKSRHGVLIRLVYPTSILEQMIMNAMD